MQNLTVKENTLTPEQFSVLFKSVGWGELPQAQIDAALKHSICTFSLYENEKLVGMGRLVGDSALEFFLRDFVISPDCQKHGYGKFLLSHIESFIKKQLQPGWTTKFQLMSAKGKEGFYQKCGFEILPNENHGSGVHKDIRGE